MIGLRYFLLIPDISDKCKFYFHIEQSKCISSREGLSDRPCASAAESTAPHNTRQGLVKITIFLSESQTLHFAGQVKYSSGKHLWEASVMSPQNLVLSFSMA